MSPFISPKDPLIASAVFKVFDVDSSGTMDFVEYMQAKRALGLNSVDEKLDWIFCLFDSDGGGTVDLNEIKVEMWSHGIVKFHGGMKKPRKNKNKDF